MNLCEHPAFKNIDPNFVRHIENTLAHSSSKSSIEVLGLLMAINNEASKRNINFTPEMQDVLLQFFKSTLPRHQRAQFDAILKTLSNNKH